MTTKEDLQELAAKSADLHFNMKHEGDWYAHYYGYIYGYQEAEQKLNIASVSGKRQDDELIQAIATQTQIIENLISGTRVVNLDEAIAYYKSIHAACASCAQDTVAEVGVRMCANESCPNDGKCEHCSSPVYYVWKSSEGQP